MRIPFDSLTLRAVVAELQERLPGGQIQDVRQPEPSDLLLDIRSQGRNWWLCLSCDAQFARLHLTETRRPNAPTPPTFCMTLRKHIESGIIQEIRQRDFDRIVEIEISRNPEGGERRTYLLIAELMGKHSNLILVNELGLVVDAAKRITHRINRVRETLPSHPYLPPPVQANRVDPFPPEAQATLLHLAQEKPSESLAGAIQATFAGMSPFLERELLLRSQPLEAEPSSGKLLRAWEAILGAAGRDEYAPVAIRSHGVLTAAYPFPTVQVPAEQQQAVSSLNAALDQVYATLRSQREFDSLMGDLRGRLERERKRLERQRESLEKTLQEAQRAETYQQTGELLRANLWQIPLGATSVVVQDYFDPAYPEREIALDSHLSPQENAELWFRRYRKAKEGLEMAQEQSAEVAVRLGAIGEAQQRLVGLQSPQVINPAEQVRELREELLERGLIRPNVTAEIEADSGPDLQGHKIRRYSTPEGYDIYLGENATANDYLTLRLASPNDLWLHVRAATSSHVVIRTKGQPEAVPKRVLEQAALLCARHSSQKHASLVAVDYTLRKFVRKPRGAAPGSADYERETTLHVTP